MYTVIDEPVVVAINRQHADQLKADLCRDNAACDWSIWKKVEPIDLNVPLERLYALTARLLEGMNPRGIVLVVANLDGTESEYNAVDIMMGARSALDQAE